MNNIAVVVSWFAVASALSACVSSIVLKRQAGRLSVSQDPLSDGAVPGFVLGFSFGLLLGIAAIVLDKSSGISPLFTSSRLLGKIAVMLAFAAFLLSKTSIILVIKAKTSRNNIKHLRTCLDLFRRDVGRFPTTEEGLTALHVDHGISGWRGPYIPDFMVQSLSKGVSYSLVRGQPELQALGLEETIKTVGNISREEDRGGGVQIFITVLALLITWLVWQKIDGITGLGIAVLAGVMILVIGGLANAKRHLSIWRVHPFARLSRPCLFLSYQSGDVALVRFVGEQLFARGINIWLNDYRIFLGSWDQDFETPLREGTGNCTGALFFTNERWAKSKWATNCEAKDLLPRLLPNECIEICLEPSPLPHKQVPNLIALRHLDAYQKDRWDILNDICNVLGVACGERPVDHLVPNKITNTINNIPCSIDVAGWRVIAPMKRFGDDVRWPLLERQEEGLTLQANMIVGKAGMERAVITSPDDREVFKQLRSFARDHFPLPSHSSFLKL